MQKNGLLGELLGNYTQQQQQ